MQLPYYWCIWYGVRVNKLTRDLPKGQSFEDFIVKKLWDRHKIKSKRIEGKHSPFDIKIDSLGQTIECKKDLKSKYTGNIVIEFECYDKPSGISVSTADYWAIQFYHGGKWKYGFVATDVLRKECEGLMKITGGDDMSSQMYLMPVVRFLEICHAFVVQR